MKRKGIQRLDLCVEEYTVYAEFGANHGFKCPVLAVESGLSMYWPKIRNTTVNIFHTAITHFIHEVEIVALLFYIWEV